MKIIILSLCVAAVSFASLGSYATDSLSIRGAGESVLQFKNFDHKYGGWRDITFVGGGDEFKVYSVANKMVASESGAVVDSDVRMLSPDKKYLMAHRTIAGELVDEQGHTVISAQTYCDVISLDTGCVENLGSVLQCDGEWQGSSWKTSGEEIFKFPLHGFGPGRLNKDVIGLPSDESRANALRDSLFMGVTSYMACYPPGKSIRDYNDLGFYFAKGGEHLLAMQIYRKLLVLSPDRVPLKLNIADSLWALGKQDEARAFYAAYKKDMLEKGADRKIPERVVSRSR